MKKLLSMLAATAALAVAGSAQAVMLGSIDVGSVDVLEGYTDTLAGCYVQGNGSSIPNETCWANSEVDPALFYFGQESTVSYAITDTSNTYAFALTGDPGYYLLKNATYWALFRNLDSTDWAVFSTAGLPSGMNLGNRGQMTISHVTTFNGTNQVPEPASLALYGLGLLGVGFASRRRARKG